MIITLHTEGWFDSAHLLKRYNGKCANLHGHTYKCEIWVRGYENDVNSAGILWDFGNLKEILYDLDHTNLSEKFGETNPTAEFLCCWLYNKLISNHYNLKFKVRIYEQLEPKRSYAEVGDF